MQFFADAVAKLCIEKYVALKKTGKPSANEWTVLAGIVAKKIDASLTLVSLATGTKCLSGKELMTSNAYDIGERLSDSHAEILARRGFILYLYDQIDLLLESKSSDILLMNMEQRIEIKHGVSFHFYCSQTPCGDCSIIPMGQDEAHFSRVLSSKRRKIEVNSGESPAGPEAKEDPLAIEDIHRTGAKCLPTEKNCDLLAPGSDYHAIGLLRTKPGRGDRTLSLSCSDKMAKWNALGIQGSLLSKFLPTIRLETVVVGGDCPFSQQVMERGIYKRFGSDICGPNILQATVSFACKRDPDRTHPCSSSILWCSIRDRCTDVIVNGRKQGATKNRKGSSLLVSRRAFLRRFFRVVEKHPATQKVPLHPKKISYQDCKEFCHSYRAEWKRLRTTIFSAWPDKPSVLQDFSLSDTDFVK